MSRRLSEDYKAITLIGATAQTAALTTGAVAVEAYDDDALVVLSVGGGSAGFTAPVSIVGALTATSTTYDQVLATFSTVTTVGTAAQRINLAGIANIKANVAPAGSTSITVAVVALVKPFVKATGNSSTTIAA